MAVLNATGTPGANADHETRLQQQATSAHGYVTVLADSEPVGIGRAVADAGWTGLFSMATAPHARRRGVARLVLTAIESWAIAHDAPQLYLQVEQPNAGARRLYRAAGFTQFATYHYREQASHLAR